MIGMEVRSAANGASAVCAAVRGAAVAVSRFNCAAAIAPAGAGVGVVAVGRPIAPDVAENAVFSAAFLAGFARGAGGRFGAAGVFKYTTMIIFIPFPLHPTAETRCLHPLFPLSALLQLSLPVQQEKHYSIHSFSHR